ncbi:MAG: glycogen/starch synthase, partial [bacterium]
MRILFLTAELEPVLSFSRVGEVAAGLARGLKNLGHDIRIIAPRFTSISPRRHALRDITRLSQFPIHFADKSFTVKVRSYSLLPSRAPVYYLDEPFHFGSDPYEPDARTNMNFSERFGFFAYAALQIVRQLDWRPEVVHCCGTPTLITPLLMRREELLAPFYSSTKVVLHLPEGEIHRDWGSIDPSLWGWRFIGEERDRVWNITQEAMRWADGVVANGSSGTLPTPWRSQYGWLEGVDLNQNEFLNSPLEKKLLEPEDVAEFKKNNRNRLAELVGHPDIAQQPIGVLWLKGCEQS